MNDLLPMTVQELGGLGVSIHRQADGSVLLVFANGTAEHWTPAPADYPTDGSMEVMRLAGVFYIPQMKES